MGLIRWSHLGWVGGGGRGDKYQDKKLFVRFLAAKAKSSTLLEDTIINQKHLNPMDSHTQFPRIGS